MSNDFDFQNNETPQNGGVNREFVWESPFTPRYSPQELAEIKERKEITRSANAIGISLILMIVFSTALSFGLIIINAVTRRNFSGEPANQQVFQVFFSIFSFTMPFIICQKVIGRRISDTVSFKKTEKGMAMPLFFLGVAFCSFCNIGASYIYNIFNAFGIDYSVGETSFPKGIFGFLLVVIARAIVPALVEEFALRGIVLGSLRRFGDGFALIASSVCFGIMHGNFEQIPFAIMVGLFLGFTVIKTNSLRVAMAIHFYNNLISVIFSYIPDSISMDTQNLIYTVLLLASLVVGMLFLKNRDGEFFTIEKSETALKSKEKYKAFFGSAGIIVFICINFLEAFSFILLNLVGG